MTRVATTTKKTPTSDLGAVEAEPTSLTRALCATPIGVNVTSSKSNSLSCFYNSSLSTMLLYTICITLSIGHESEIRLYDLANNLYTIE